MIRILALLGLLLALAVGLPWLLPEASGSNSLLLLMLAHLALAAAATALAGGAGMAIGITVTRPGGVAFRDLANSLLALAQAMPPVAVLALAVPALGFGWRPALVALALYGVLPVAQNTLAGLDGVAPDLRDAADGLGFSHWRRLWALELPLAAPLVLAGMRIAMVVNIGTAAIASAVGARSLGIPIILGLDGGNTQMVLAGTILVALLAATADAAFAWVQARSAAGARQ